MGSSMKSLTLHVWISRIALPFVPISSYMDDPWELCASTGTEALVTAAYSRAIAASQDVTFDAAFAFLGMELPLETVDVLFTLALGGGTKRMSRPCSD